MNRKWNALIFPGFCKLMLVLNVTVPKDAKTYIGVLRCDEFSSEPVAWDTVPQRQKIDYSGCVKECHETNKCYLHSCPRALLVSAVLSHPHITPLLIQSLQKQQ